MIVNENEFVSSAVCSLGDEEHVPEPEASFDDVQTSHLHAGTLVTHILPGDPEFYISEVHLKDPWFMSFYLE